MYVKQGLMLRFFAELLTLFKKELVKFEYYEKVKNLYKSSGNKEHCYFLPYK